MSPSTASVSLAVPVLGAAAGTVHDHHPHPHDHGPDHGAAPPPTQAGRGLPSLLMAGVGLRLLGVGLLLALLWLAVAWALGEPA